MKFFDEDFRFSISNCDDDCQSCDMCDNCDNDCQGGDCDSWCDNCDSINY